MPPPTRISQILEKLDLIAKNTGEPLTESLDRVARNTHRPFWLLRLGWMLLEVTLAGLIASFFGYRWIEYSDTRKEWAEDEKIFCAAQAETDANHRLLDDNFAAASVTREILMKEGVANLSYLPSLPLGALDLLLKHNPPQELLSNRQDWRRMQEISLEIQTHNHFIAARNNFLTLYLANVSTAEEKKRMEILLGYDRNMAQWIKNGLPYGRNVSMSALLTELQDILKKYPRHRNVTDMDIKILSSMPLKCLV